LRNAANAKPIKPEESVMFTSTDHRRCCAAKTLIVGAALLGFLGSASAALADAQADGSLTKNVSLADLDLSTAAGQYVANERAHQMARKLCRGVRDPLDLSAQQNFVRCVDAAMEVVNAKLEALVSRKAGSMVVQNSSH
jgi:UrcA family protein